MNDRKRAFLRYKQAVAENGKPFFPYGVWHDVIAASLTLLVIIGLTVIWFAQANCDSWWNVSCDRVSTPVEQEQFLPDAKDPTKVQLTDSGKVDHSVDKPLLGPLYEVKADPATTSYHPRPEWYFYFLFYLLIVFKEPSLLILGTIGLPTIWLMLLIAWPFLDRRRERRPSRRPIAMSAMVLTAIVLLFFSYKGSQQGKETGGPEGLTEAQTEMPGYAVLFDGDGVFETCQSCHQLGGSGNTGPGPALDAVGSDYSVEEIASIMVNGAGNGGMPVRGGATIDDQQVADVSAFLATLGNAEAADSAEITGFGEEDVAAIVEASGG